VPARGFERRVGSDEDTEHLKAIRDNTGKLLKKPVGGIPVI
jgi:hypothetical protein